MDFLECLESPWNAPRVHVATAVLQADTPCDVSVDVEPRAALFATQRPFALYIHVREYTGLFTCASALGTDNVCVHATGASIYVACAKPAAQTTLHLRLTARGRAFAGEVHARVMLHHCFSNDGQALVDAIFKPALRRLQQLCESLLAKETTADVHAAASVLVHDTLTHAAVLVPATPDAFAPAEIAELEAWTLRARPTQRVPTLSHVPARFLHSALESRFLALGAAMLAEKRRDSLLKRMQSFLTESEAVCIRECAESISAHVNDVYSVTSLVAAEHETNSKGAWTRDVMVSVRTVSVHVAALMNKCA